GLGKTIEAGLILLPLLSSGRVKRLLILCPASLVDQWQSRLLDMFDIRLNKYITELDTEKSDYWNGHDQVVASLQTLRADQGSRQNRLLAAEPWDMIMVDEAHHLNADEKTGPTLGYQFVSKLMDAHKAESVVFFTGTPHRGKDFGFWSLMNLLRPDLFSPDHSSFVQLESLRKAMIRNNKQNVTDLKGDRLFEKPTVSSNTYQYTPEEAYFYEKLTNFISTGKAYASGLRAADGRLANLVLTTMQKLASSSVAAIRHALRNRLERIVKARREKEFLEQQAEQLQGHVLERQRGSVEQFQHPLAFVELLQGRDGGMGKAAIGGARQFQQPFGRQAIADKGLHDLLREFGIGQARHHGDLVRRERRPAFGHIEAAIGGEPRERHFLEIQRRSGPTRADVLHHIPQSVPRAPSGAKARGQAAAPARFHR
ncbi:MAG: DEAD/DEAH box helicase family protein, partial [Proteobacteria bacterium]|nr:DEAD/DEAH box helicase family protein [Pseudomonadota bacterium]